MLYFKIEIFIYIYINIELFVTQIFQMQIIYVVRHGETDTNLNNKVNDKKAVTSATI